MSYQGIAQLPLQCCAEVHKSAEATWYSTRRATGGTHMGYRG
jgi:hypothetical protein